MPSHHNRCHSISPPTANTASSRTASRDPRTSSNGYKDGRSRYYSSGGDDYGNGRVTSGIEYERTSRYVDLPPEQDLPPQYMGQHSISPTEGYHPYYVSTWSMKHVDEFFSSRGYAEEVAYLQQAEFDTQQAQLFSGGTVTPIQIFSLKLGMRLLETLRSMRKLVEDAKTANESRFSYGGMSFESGGGSRGRGRGRGGGGGGGNCFKCNEPGHFARECPQDGGDGGRGGSRRGRGSGRGGGRNTFNDSSSWSENTPPAKRPRTSNDDWDDWGSGSTSKTNAPAAAQNDDSDWEDDSTSKNKTTKSAPAAVQNGDSDWEDHSNSKSTNQGTATATPAATTTKVDDDDDW